MPLRFEPDVTQAAWFATRDEPWVQLCCLGPSGFEHYGRLFHPLQPGGVETDPEDLVNVEGDLEESHLRRLVGVLARHTGTSDDCFFALWEGFGMIHGSPSVGVGDPEIQIPPSFPPEVMAGPRVAIPNRRYLLIRGALRDVGDWGSADLLPGQPRRINSPNLVWPADQAWLVATEIDQPWTGVGGSAALLEDLLADPVLDVEGTELTDRPPYRRS